MADYFGDFICFIKSYISGISITGEVTARMMNMSVTGMGTTPNMSPPRYTIAHWPAKITASTLRNTLDVRQS